IGKFVDEALFKDWQDFCGVLHKEYDFYKNGKPIVDKWIMRAKLYEDCKRQDKSFELELEKECAEKFLDRLQESGALNEAIFFRKHAKVERSYQDMVYKCLTNLNPDDVNYFDLQDLKILCKKNMLKINKELLNLLFKKGHNKILKLFLDQGDIPELFYDKARQYKKYQMIQLLELYKFTQSNKYKIKKSSHLTDRAMVVLFCNENLMLMQFNNKGMLQKKDTIYSKVKNFAMSSTRKHFVIVKANELFFYKHKNISYIKKKKFLLHVAGKFKGDELLALSSNGKYLVCCSGVFVAAYSISKRIEPLLTKYLPLIHNAQPIDIKIDNNALVSYKFFKPYNERQVDEKKVSLQESLTQSVVPDHKL
ncbi:MAG: hypothetical protein PVI75_08935, partial [Gammaproteobacteria bacterium]